MVIYLTSSAPVLQTRLTLATLTYITHFQHNNSHANNAHAHRMARSWLHVRSGRTGGRVQSSIQGTSSSSSTTHTCTRAHMCGGKIGRILSRMSHSQRGIGIYIPDHDTRASQSARDPNVDESVPRKSYRKRQMFVCRFRLERPSPTVLGIRFCPAHHHCVLPSTLR